MKSEQYSEDRTEHTPCTQISTSNNATENDNSSRVDVSVKSTRRELLQVYYREKVCMVPPF